MQHSSIITSYKSVFQGHFYPMHTEGEGIQALRALLQSEKTLKSSHIMYAYNYIDENGETITGHSDDGEWGGSCILSDLLKEKSISNAILMVTRIYGGQNLGNKRFTYIKQVATDVLET